MNHVLITGGAGAIGGAIARALYKHDRHSRMSIVDVDREGAEKFAKTMGDEGRAYVWDLSKPDELDAQWDAVVAERGPVDVLINCAGIMDIRSFASSEWKPAMRLMKIDLESPLRLMALAVPGMIERKRGTIVNVSSMAGVTPLRGCSFYGAAKAGIAMASEVARIELEEHGVHVVTVYPGPVKSELERKARAQTPPTLITRLIPTGDAEPLGEKVLEACVKKLPRVVYPPFYEAAAALPSIASRITAMMSPKPHE